MGLDGIFLNKLTCELQILKTGRISKINQLSETDLLFVIRANRENYNLIVSISNEYSRVHLSNKEYISPPTPIGLTMFLRKHIEGYLIENIYTNELDRVLVLDITGINEIGDFEAKKIIIEIMGRHSNFIITKNNVILEALRHQGVFDAKRTMLPNAIYQFPSLDNKYNPLELSLDEIERIFLEKNISSSKDITSSFQGISPLLANQVFKGKVFYHKFYELIHKDISATIFTNNNKTDFYYFNDNFDNAKTYNSLNEVLDVFYYDLANQERIKQKTNDLLLSINRNISRLKLKLEKLNTELDEAKNSDIYRIYGELLLANIYNQKENSSSITVLNYYENNDITIPLDPKYNLIANSKIYFKKYQKSKTAVIHLNEQINKTNDEIEYLTLIHSQVLNANLNDIIEIQEELEKEKYITLKQKKGKTLKPKILTYATDDNTIIMVGKNNIQNELITHKLSLPNEMWFHVKDGPGSHVVVKKTDNLTENDIRIAANIAAIYSLQKESSSVAVNYTLIRYIKKIPGKRNCFVTISHEKTIFIDPCEFDITKIKVKK